MPQFGPVSRRELVRRLSNLGFSGPYPGGNHEFMAKGTLRVRIPNPHTGDIDRSLIARITQPSRSFAQRLGQRLALLLREVLHDLRQNLAAFLRESVINARPNSAHQPVTL